MKPTARLRSFLAIASTSLLAISYTHAATLYWDGNDTTGNADGGAGFWDNLLTNWDTLAAGGSNSAWSAGSIAVFGGSGVGFTVTLTDNITVGGLTFNKVNGGTNYYTIDAATNSKTLSFSSGDNYISLNIGNGGPPNATITGQVAGTGANVIVAPQSTVASGGSTNFGTVTFNGASTGGWTGATTINAAGTLTTVSTVALTNKVLNDTSGITLNGGTIQFTRDGNTALGAITGNAIGVNGGGTFSVTSTNGGASAIEDIGTVTVNSGQMNFVQTANNLNQLVLGGLSRGATTGITFSSVNLANARLKVSSAGTTSGWVDAAASNSIIGAWATTGSAAATQTDYAVYNGDFVTAANTAASAETSWSDAAKQYTLSYATKTATALTATRNIAALKASTPIASVSTAVLSGTSTFTVASGHSFAVNDPVVIGTPPGGFVAGRVYYVQSVGGGSTTFTLSATPGGAAINATSNVTATFAGGIKLDSGINLGTTGILNSGTAPIAIGRTLAGSGSISLPTAGAGNLFINAGSGNIGIDVPIVNNGGALTLVKTGNSILHLSNNNTFSGGLVVNAGTLRLSGTQSFTGGVTLSGGAFGDSTDGISAAELGSNSVTVNGNASMYITSGETLAGAIAINSTGNLKLNGPTSALGGVVSGSGVLTITGQSGPTVTLTNTANTHTGVISLVSDNNTAANLAVNSLADSASPGAGNIQMGGGGTLGSYLFALNSGAIAPLILNNRQVELVGDGPSAAYPFKLANNSAQAFTINSNLLASGTNVKTLTLGGSGAGLSTFGGTITNGSHTTLNLTKVDGSNTWSLTNAANSYNGVTTVTAGTLRFSSIANAGSNSSLGNFATAGATGISLGGGTLQYTGANVSVDRGFTVTAGSTIDVNPAATTLTLGASSLGGAILTVTGGVGSSLGLGALTLTGSIATLNPTTADLTVASIGGTQNLVLGGTLSGTSAGSTVTGAINIGTGTLTKNTGSTWTLSGTNGYTGTTTVSAGLLRVNGSLNASSAVTVSGGAIGGTGTINGTVSLTTAGGINLANGSVGNLTLASTLAITGAAGANSLRFDLGSAAAGTDKIIVSGAPTVTNNGVVVSFNQIGGNAARINAGTYTLIQGTSAPTLANYALATTAAFGQTFALGVTGNNLELTTTQVTGAVLANTTLTGTAPSWQTLGNFSGAAVPDYASNVIINSAIGNSPLNGSTNINSLTYGSSATTGTTISAGTPATSMLTIEAGAVNGNAAGNGITLNNASGTHTISANIGLAASQTWTVGTGGILLISGTVSDFGGGYGLTKAGSGLLDIKAVAPTYTGTTTITGGAILGGSILPSGNLTLNGGVYEGYNNAGFTRPLGSGVGQIQITGGISGFSGYGASTFGITGTGSAPLVWGSTYFAPSEFLLQDALTPAANPDYRVTFTNNIDLNGANRTVSSTMVSNIVLGGGYLTGNLSNSTGTAGLIKNGVGQIVLSGTNTYNGGTTISQGILRFDTLTSMPATGAVSVSGGATLGVTVASTGTTWGGGASNGGIAGLTSTANAGSGFGGQAGSSVSFAAGNSNLLLNVTGDTTESNNITNGGATNLSLIKIGANNLTLSGNNSYSGGTTLTAGTITVGSNTAIPSSGTIALNGGTIQSNDATARTFTNAVTIGGNFTVGGTGNLTFSNTAASALGAARTITITNSGTTAEFAQAFSGAFAINKAGAGTLVLSGNNTNLATSTNPTFTNAGGGVLVFSKPAALTGIMQVSNSTGTYRIQSDSDTTSSASGIQSFTAGAILNLQVDRQTAGSGTGLDYNFTNGNSGANDISGGATVNISAGSNITSGTPNVSITQMRSQGGTTTGTATITASGVDVSIGSLTATANGADFWGLGGTSTGNVVTGAISHPVIKQGAGTWTLSSSSNAYAGSTTISNGTLKLGANNVLPNASNVSIGAATLDAATFDDSVGTLDVSDAASTINLDSGANLAFAASNAVDWTGGTLNLTGTLNFSGGPSSSLRFGTTNVGPTAGLTAGQLLQITSPGWTSFALDADGYLTATPSGGDVTPPTLTSITDNVGGGPITEDASVTYTVTFNEDIDSATVSIADFDNQGTATVAINSVVETGANTGIFTVVATPSTPGTLRLRIPSGAVVTDTSANPLVVPVSDDTTITVRSKYEAWSGALDFDTDTNGDGVKNGLAFLLGAANKNVSALGLLPTVTQSGGNLILTFNMLNAANRKSASIKVQQSRDLGISDAWVESAVVPDLAGLSPAVNGVTFNVTLGSPTNAVVATVAASEALPGTKLFGRLKANQ